MLTKHGLEDCKKVKTPIVKGEDESFLPKNEIVGTTMHQELIRELLFISNRTHPDISFVTTTVYS